LGVARSASQKDIKFAYFQKAKLLHPDTCSGDKESAKKQFLTLSEAYKMVQSEEKRKQHDATESSTTTIYTHYSTKQTTQKRSKPKFENDYSIFEDEFQNMDMFDDELEFVNSFNFNDFFFFSKNRRRNRRKNRDHWTANTSSYKPSTDPKKKANSTNSMNSKSAMNSKPKRPSKPPQPNNNQSQRQTENRSSNFNFKFEPQFFQDLRSFNRSWKQFEMQTAGTLSQKESNKFYKKRLESWINIQLTKKGVNPKFKKQMATRFYRKFTSGFS